MGAFALLSLLAAALALPDSGYHRSFILPAGLDDLHDLHASEAGRTILPIIGLPGRRQSYEGRFSELAQLLRSDRREYAPAYYAMCWSFVSYLVAEIGYGGLRAVAESGTPSDTVRNLTARSMAEQIAAWEGTLVDPPG